MEVVCGPPQALTGVALEEPFPVEVPWDAATFTQGTGPRGLLGTEGCDDVEKPRENHWEMIYKWCFIMFYPHGIMEL